MLSLLDFLRKWGRETPDAPAWWVEAERDKLRSLSWLEVAQVVESFAAKLPEAPGERILSYLPNGLDWVIVDLACQLRGLIHAPIDVRIPSSQIDEFVDYLRPILVLRSLDIPPPFSRSYGRGAGGEGSHQAAENQAATILFTSGSSGTPRGVMLSRTNLLHNALGKLEALPQFSSDRRLNLLPFSHAYARTCELSTWLLTGGSMLCASNFEDALRLAPIFKPTLYNAVPYVFEKIQRLLPQVDRPIEQRRGTFDDLFGGKMRVMASGGAGLMKETFAYFAELGLPIIQGYGLTEASPVVCSNRVDNPQADNVGPPIHDTELRIDEDQKLYVRGPGVMLGYWNDDEATRRKIVGGWLDTGDRAERLSNGSIRIFGRCDDRIVLSTGEKIDPAPIEERLLRLKAIRSVVLAGHGKSFVSAVIVSQEAEDLNLPRINSELNDLPNYAIPKRLIIESEDWTVESGLLNHKGAVIRRAVLDRYRLDLGRLYHPSLGRRQESLDPSQSDQQGRRAEDHRDHVQQ
jgi:long-chain acyl-CoA synthetase